MNNKQRLDIDRIEMTASYQHNVGSETVYALCDEIRRLTAILNKANEQANALCSAPPDYTWSDREVDQLTALQKTLTEGANPLMTPPVESDSKQCICIKCQADPDDDLTWAARMMHAHALIREFNPQ